MLLLAYELRSLNTMAVLFLFFLSLYVCAAIAGLPFKNPNVLMLVVDDLRPCLKPYGNPIVKAPAVEALINKSTQFHNAHAQQALCGPSRTSFLTGRMPDTLRCFSQDANYWRRRHNYTTLPQYFKSYGYHTISIGKVFHPGHISGRHDDYPYSWSDVPYHPPTEVYKNAKVCRDIDGSLHSNLNCPVELSSQPDHTLPDIQTTNHTIKVLHDLKKKSKPFFMAVGFHKPHIPFKYPKYFEGLPSVAWNPFMDVKVRDDVARLNITFPYGEVPKAFQKQIIRNYYSSISYIDSLVEQIISSLVDLALLDNTIIAFVSDHGWSLGEHGEWAKYSNYDVATRVPLSIYVPPRLGYSLISHVYDMVELIDLFPTLVELAGIGSLPTCTSRSTITCTEGKSLVPQMQGRQISINANISVAQYPRPSLHPQDNSDQPEAEDIRFMGYALKSTTYRYVRWVSFNASSRQSNLSAVYAEELYDTRVDPGEDHNLIKSRPHVALRLSSLLGKYISIYDEP